MNNAIIEYIRDSKGRKQGVIAALRQGDKVQWGFSLCSKHDTFDKKVGLGLALSRASTEAPAALFPVHTPAVFLKKLPVFRERAERYFKGCQVLF